MSKTWLTYQPKNVQVSVFTWKQRTCTVCGEAICIQGQNGLCSRCMGLLVIDDSRRRDRENLGKRNRPTKHSCLECGKPLHRGNNHQNKTGLCHDCSCSANGRKRLGKGRCGAE